MARRPSATASIKRLQKVRRELERLQAETKELTDLVRDVLAAAERNQPTARVPAKTRRKRAHRR